MARQKSSTSEESEIIASPDVEQAITPELEATVPATLEVKPEPTEAPTPELEATVPATPEVEPEPTAPVALELQTQKDSGLKEKASKESIEAAIKEKLSRKTDSDGIDPFVPSVQLDKEVKDIANKGGFPLSRGTEIGARLMARANRITK
jgi:hypothetical protein